MRILSYISALVILLQSFIALIASSFLYWGLLTDSVMPFVDDIILWFLIFLGPLVFGLFGFATIHFLIIYFPWGRFRIRENNVFLARSIAAFIGLVYFIISFGVVISLFVAS